MNMEPYRADHMMERQRRERRNRLIAGAIAGTVLFFGIIVSGSLWHWAFHDLPDTPQSAAELWSTRREPSVTLQDMNGDVLAVRGPLYARAVGLDTLPDHVPNAFLAIEDQRFFDHAGVDYRGLMRAVWTNIGAGRSLQGGSTITMQLVKNLILSPERRLRRKLQEIRIAWALEDQLSKTEILELYLNRIYLGARAYGVEAAAQRYFGKSSTQLDLAEAALLAALPKAPSRLDPTVNLEAAQARAAIVLAAMLEAGFIDQAAHDQALANPAVPSAPPLDPNAGVTWGHVFDYAVAEADRLLMNEDIPDLVIRTTINPELTREARAAALGVLDEQGDALGASEAAVMLLAPDGAIRAFHGGRDYLDSQFNRAIQAQRQPGSAFKPIVFTAALEAGYDPSSAVWDEPVDLEGWTPQNFSGNYRGLVTLQEALKRSINTVAAQIGDQLGIEQIVETGQRMGIRSPLPALPSIALGAAEANLLELTSAYAVFARDGQRHEPYFVVSLSNSRGEVLYEHEASEPDQVLRSEVAQSMSTMMQDVILTGTGRRAALPGRASGGKTGTSQSFRDAWFIGFTADYTAGVWVGNDDDSPMRDVTGGGLPAQIWQRFMLDAHEGLPVRPLSAAAPRTRSEREERLAAFYSELSDAFSDLLDPSGPDDED
ncbi:PBP1A family penicillin-binding protein [Maricaulis sp.]|uniref:transglycosylase domain-containing protein n=1 Tax=Maricaulis sp. TaxID=1486257 RepID=UPI0026374E51|nr:PBP1A family penicillin-binding protein [Maricaulis sp.]